jgi:hypothetical protein
VGSHARVGEPNADRSAPRAKAAPKAGVAATGRIMPRRDRWESRYMAATIATDLLAIAIMVEVGYVLGLAGLPSLGSPGDRPGFGGVQPSHPGRRD